MAPKLPPIPALHLTWTGPWWRDPLVTQILDRVLRAELGERLPEAALGHEATTDGAHEVTVAANGELEPTGLAALLARHTSAAVLAQRVAYLRRTAVLPESDGVPVAAWDHRSQTTQSEVDPAAMGRVVVLPMRPLDDAAAVLSVAAVVVTEDPVLAAAAESFGTPGVAPGELVEFESSADRISPPDHSDTLRRLDEVAASVVADVAAASGLSTAELQARRVAFFARAHHDLLITYETALNRTAMGRLQLTEALQDALAGQDLLRAELEVAHGTLRGETERREHVESELEAVYATRTFRATEGLRNLYARLRGRPSAR